MPKLNKFEVFPEAPGRLSEERCQNLLTKYKDEGLKDIDAEFLALDRGEKGKRLVPKRPKIPFAGESGGLEIEEYIRRVVAGEID